MNSDPACDIAARIDALLPQTQCTRCGYPGCEPYAAAIAGGRSGDQPVSAGRQRDHCCAGRTAWAGRPALESGAWRRRRRRASRGSTSRAASAARAACRPVRWMPSSAPQSSCTPWSPSAAPAASCACRPARSIASKCGRGREPAANRAGAQPQRDSKRTRHAPAKRAAERQRELDAKKAAAPRSPRRRAVNAAKRRAIFERLRAANPAPRTELVYRVALRTPGRRDSVGSSHRQERQQGDRGSVSRRQHAGSHAGTGRGRAVATTSNPSGSTTARRRTSLPPCTDLARAARRRGAAHRARRSSSCRGSAARRPT